MLFAVEGGGFFTSSASGYRNGLTLLILGQTSDEKRMRVAPWNHYQLVERETGSDLQLASCKNRLSSGCATFVCFSRTSAELNGQSPLKPQGILPTVPEIERDKELKTVVDDDDSARNISLKSSLKKSTQNIRKIIYDGDEQEPLFKEDNDNDNDPEAVNERRKVQWTDACGKELTEIREFELSEHGESDDEFFNRNAKSCSCRIM
ncbi:hypothetical protein RND81_03G061900 [Saponaria officinalis]|uniref:Uncharacterized protein n=1 Tax=Saponaria officinalis TaxID=3572 RepID=A0AAW1M4D3_SAPOF